MRRAKSAECTRVRGCTKLLSWVLFDYRQGKDYMEKWMVAAKKADFKQIAEQYHISMILARLIRNRDITEDTQIER